MPTDRKIAVGRRPPAYFALWRYSREAALYLISRITRLNDSNHPTSDNKTRGGDNSTFCLNTEESLVCNSYLAIHNRDLLNLLNKGLLRLTGCRVYERRHKTCRSTMVNPNGRVSHSSQGRIRRIHKASGEYVDPDFRWSDEERRADVHLTVIVTTQGTLLAIENETRAN
jgi:hypothetical protein